MNHLKDYVIPLGKARIALESDNIANTICIITYGMGVYWAINAAKEHKGQVEVVDLELSTP